MHKLFMLCELPINFMRWYSSKHSHDVLPPPPVNIVASPLYISKPQFEAIFHYLTMYAWRQSDREVPCTPFRNGVTNLMHLNGQEYPGLVMLSLVALKGLLHNKLPLRKQEEIILLFWRMLVLNDMMNLSDNTESTLELL
jgi:hypothetical protein